MTTLKRDFDLTAMTQAATIWFDRRSRAVALFLDHRLEAMIGAWLALVTVIGLLKVGLAPVPPHNAIAAAAMVLPFLLVAISPVLGYRIAQASFPRQVIGAQPALRLSRYGRWRPLDVLTARNHPAFGAGGFMVSLIAGILLNVPFRSAEFLMAVPAIGAGAPDWASLLLTTMTIDVVVMNFFYAVCFVMALRSAPLFPRMLLFAWTVDILLQLSIAQTIGAAPGLPLPVADALHGLLHGNIQKVLISAALWLPYLIVSERVNVTFRSRERA